MIHPFHPAVGQEFELVTSRQSWGEDRAYFVDATGQLRSFPASFTTLAPPDPFVAIAAGRAHLRTEDLVRLAKLVEELLHEKLA